MTLKRSAAQRRRSFAKSFCAIGTSLTVHVKAQTLPILNGDVAETLRKHATLFHADLIVMGGYVHSRLRELVFGGVTESLLKQSPVPLFMAY